MSLTPNRLYLLKEVFTKVKYDKLNERFYIALEDYAFLNLEPSVFTLLNNMCNENNIYLETFPKRLKPIETQKLFAEYKKIETKLNETKDPDEIEKLEKSLQEIKDKIIIGHMRQVCYKINKRIPGMKDIKDKEDIYQIGYETLLEFFDIYDPDKDTTFAYFINKYILHRIIRKMYRSNFVLGNENLALLAKVKKAKRILDAEKESYSIDDLVKKTGIGKAKIKDLLTLEELMNLPTTDFEEEPKEDSLIDYNFEEDTIEHILEGNNHLEKLVNLLPEKERMVMRLHYCFEDGKKYTYQEIAGKMGLTIQRVEQLNESGLTILTKYVGSKYLKDIYGEPKHITKGNVYSSIYEERQKRDIIINIIEPEIILSIINTFHPTNKEMMLLHYGLKDGKKYEVEEISKIIDLGKPLVSKTLKSLTNILIKRIVKKENLHFEGDYFEYLVSKYLNKPKRKHK